MLLQLNNIICHHTFHLVGYTGHTTYFPVFLKPHTRGSSSFIRYDRTGIRHFCLLPVTFYHWQLSLAKIEVTFAKASSSVTSFPLKYSHNTGLVISSAVGPSPPVYQYYRSMRLSSSKYRQSLLYYLQRLPYAGARYQLC